MEKYINEQIGKHWGNIRNTSNPERVRWWESPHIIRHYNKLVCGRPVDGTSQGIVEFFRARCGEQLPYQNAISVGGSNGWKERILLSAGVVNHFTVYELSESLVQEGHQLSLQQGLGNRIDFIVGDAFKLANNRENFDLVYWDNSLHHMFNVDEAVKWSKNVLREGGCFFMNDFVGPTRMQWSQVALDAGTAVRQILPPRYLENPYSPGTQLDKVINRPDPKVFEETDPSECADSGAILQAISKYFPDIEIKLTGGVIYHGALSDVLHNINENEPNERALLDLMLQIDNLLAELGETHYGVGFAVKPFQTKVNAGQPRSDC